MKICRTPFAPAILLAISSIGFSSLAQAAVCDVDKDGDVDRRDLGLIVSARNTPAGGPGDPRDADGDGNITMVDARTCVRQCNLSGCKIIDPGASPATGNAGQLDAPGATRMQEAVKDAGKPGVATSERSGSGNKEQTTVRGTEWRVKRGDTLYAISRAVYPGDGRRQARLRQDIVKLNPAVFANGANNMSVGVVLKLPDYVVSASESATVAERTQVPAPVAEAATPEPSSLPAAPEPSSQPAAPVAVVKPEPETPYETAPPAKTRLEPEPKAQAKKEPSTAREPSTSSTAGGPGNVFVNLGYSFGGDKLLDIDGSYDVFAGSGVHVRLGYEKMYQRLGGYRVALGLQYNLVYDSNQSTTFKDVYLQLAYQYRADPFVYGIGVVFHEGATLEEFSTSEYDAANGAVLYLENVGSGSLAGWGLSYTSLDIEEKGTSTSFDASGVEFYYGWKF
ncbi:MAG: hypothetical protein OEO19_18430 [Gammaproteobacteria bacterium]|nr:hypothetical protein [Gammaproteobacteria bacterium]MDH3447710.1 hypothetical protein [Gammaproteobacteria bacterium]